MRPVFVREVRCKQCNRVWAHTTKTKPAKCPRCHEVTKYGTKLLRETYINNDKLMEVMNKLITIEGGSLP